MVVLFFALVIAAAGIGAFYLSRRLAHRRLMTELQMQLLLIRLPVQSIEGKDVVKEIALSEQLFSALASFREPFVFEVAVPYVGEEIHFYLAVPHRLTEAVARQVQSLWNDADVHAVEDYNIFNYRGSVAAAWVKEKERFVLPLRSYREIGADTFAPTLGGFSNVKELGEGAALQVVARPAPARAAREVRSTLEVLKKGAGLKSILGGSAVPLTIGDVKEALNPASKEKKQERKEVDAAVVEAIGAKVGKPLFEVNIRILTSAPNPVEAESLLGGITAGFSQFGAPDRNGLKIIIPRNPAAVTRDFIFRSFDRADAMVLSSEELASLFHLPTAFTETPRIKALKAREAPPPADAPTEGTFLGESLFRGGRRRIYLTDEDRRRHLYVLGQTGTGKTTLLKSLILEDMKSGKGVGVIDPHGEFAEFVLANVPAERAEDVIVFDPGDLEHPVGLNMLEYRLDRPEEKTFIVNDMLAILEKLYDLRQTGGPMFEQYLRQALLLLMEDASTEPATLVELPRVFTDTAWRAKKLARIRNPIVQDFWEKEAAKAGGEASLANLTPYVTSKFNNFIANDYVRPIIGQTKSAMDFRAILDGGKILVVNLRKGKIGDANMALLGMIILSKVLFAALSRGDTPSEAERRDWYLYIDEFQNFATDSIGTILSEARKYRLDLTVAHQFIAQLPEKIRDAVFGNVGSEVVLRVGPQDAEFLAKQFEPTVGAADLQNIDNLNAYVRLLVRGQTVKPFNIRISTDVFAIRGDPGRAEEVRERSRRAYGRDRREVEEEIRRRLREF